MPLLLFCLACAAAAADSDSPNGGAKRIAFPAPALQDNPYAEIRYKANFIIGDKTSSADTLKIKAGTDGFRVAAYGKKPEGEDFEMTSIRAGLSPFKGKDLSLDVFYGAVSSSGLASRIRSAPSTSSATVYSPAKPTRSRFFGQGTSSDKNRGAAELLAGGFRAALYSGSTEGCPEALWFAAGWVGKPPAAKPATTLSVMAFGGKGLFQEKEATSWFPASTHRDNESENVYAGGELSLKTKHTSFFLFMAASDGALRPDSGRIMADAALYGKHGRISLFYALTDREYLPLSGSKPTMLEKAGLSPYFTWTFRKRRFFRIAAGAQGYIALKRGDKVTDSDSSYWFVGSYITFSTLATSFTVREKATSEKIQFEAAFKSSALLSRKLVLSATAKVAFPYEFDETESESVTAQVKYRFTLHHELGLKGEMEKEDSDDEREYTATLFYADRISFKSMKMDLAAQLSAHTDTAKKFSGSVTATLYLK